MMVIACVFWDMAVDFDESDNCFLQTDSEDFIKDIVGQTSGFMLRDMRALIADTGANLIPRCQTNKLEPGGTDNSLRFKAVQDTKSCEEAPQVPGKDDLAKALERSKKRNASALGTPKVN